MSTRNTTTDDRRRANEKRQHSDKYADKRADPGERVMAEKLAELAAHFNTREADRG